MKDIIDAVSSIITSTATILAGAWAYYRFVKGRVFKPRLTLNTTGRRLRDESTDYVLSTLEVRNVGLSRVDIDSATLRICSLSGKGLEAEVTLPKRDWLGTSRVLLAHTWIESGESLKEQTVFILPFGYNLPLVLDYKIVVGSISFTAETIVGTSERDAAAETERQSS